MSSPLCTSWCHVPDGMEKNCCRCLVERFRRTAKTIDVVALFVVAEDGAVTYIITDETIRIQNIPAKFFNLDPAVIQVTSRKFSTECIIGSISRCASQTNFIVNAPCMVDRNIQGTPRTNKNIHQTASFHDLDLNMIR